MAAVDDVGGACLVRGVGTRRVRARDVRAHGVKALARPRAEGSGRLEGVLWHGEVLGGDIIARLRLVHPELPVELPPGESYNMPQSSFNSS